MLYEVICLPKLFRAQDIVRVNVSLRILSNLAVAGALHSNVALDDMIRELLVFTDNVINMKSLDGNGLTEKVIT